MNFLVQQGDYLLELKIYELFFFSKRKSNIDDMSYCNAPISLYCVNRSRICFSQKRLRNSNSITNI